MADWQATVELNVYIVSKSQNMGYKPVMSERTSLVLRLREMILSGKFQPGERVAEMRVAELLGVSRTPVRAALGVLSREGLVVPGAGNRGYLVRAVTFKEILDATELRGVLEGVAARQVAEGGLDAQVREELEDAIRMSAAAFARRRLAANSGTLWAAQNERFHRAIVNASGNGPLIHALAVNNQVPFSGAGAYLEDVEDSQATEKQYAILRAAQHDHETILACLKRGEGARVEALMREHCYLAIENIGLFRNGIELGARRPFFA
jgi:GntR family transcriptional regulator of vanillate catabolism